jgi:hypothetical protein
MIDRSVAPREGIALSWTTLQDLQLCDVEEISRKGRTSVGTVMAAWPLPEGTQSTILDAHRIETRAQR